MRTHTQNLKMKQLTAEWHKFQRRTFFQSKQSIRTFGNFGAKLVQLAQKCTKAA